MRTARIPWSERLREWAECAEVSGDTILVNINVSTCRAIADYIEKLEGEPEPPEEEPVVPDTVTNLTLRVAVLEKRLDSLLRKRFDDFNPDGTMLYAAPFEAE